MQMRAFWHSLNLCPVLKTFLLVQSATMPKETILLWFAAMAALTTQLDAINRLDNDWIYVSLYPSTNVHIYEYLVTHQ